MFYIATSFLLLASRIVLEAVTGLLLGKSMGGGTLYKYDSPLVVIAAVGLLVAFSNEKLLANRAKEVTFMSSSSFAVFVFEERVQAQGARRLAHDLCQNRLWYDGGEGIHTHTILAIDCFKSIDIRPLYNKRLS
ncbi:MAG: hypothetical protein IKF14_05560 [Atopobiaceae bacterium]|nr:hypothetical protein [Atopobiaceae bacterium]